MKERPARTVYLTAKQCEVLGNKLSLLEEAYNEALDAFKRRDWWRCIEQCDNAVGYAGDAYQIIEDRIIDEPEEWQEP